MIRWKYILFVIVLIISCSTNIQTHEKRLAVNDGTGEALKLIRIFVDLRSAGNYIEAETLLTDTFMLRFTQRYNNTFAEHFRHHDERHFKDSTVLKIVSLDASTYRATLLTEVEIPGFTISSNEVFTIVYIKGHWKIEDWQYKELESKTMKF